MTIMISDCEYGGRMLNMNGIANGTDEWEEVELDEQVVPPTFGSAPIVVADESWPSVFSADNNNQQQPYFLVTPQSAIHVATGNPKLRVLWLLSFVCVLSVVMVCVCVFVPQPPITYLLACKSALQILITGILLCAVGMNAHDAVFYLTLAIRLNMAYNVCNIFLSVIFTCLHHAKATFIDSIGTEHVLPVIKVWEVPLMAGVFITGLFLLYLILDIILVDALIDCEQFIRKSTELERIQAMKTKG